MTGALGDRVNTIAFVCGVKGSGKSQLLADLFVRPTPRVLTLEFTRWEAATRNPDAIRTIGLAHTFRALEVCAPHARWHIVAALEEEEVPDLFELLCPPLTSGSDGYSVQVGGMAVECSECDLIAPTSATPRAIRSAFKRGRHYGLSLYMATQRPHECARIVTSQADHIVSFQQFEPLDLDYLGQAMSRAVAAQVPQLPRYWCVWYERTSGKVFVKDAERRTRRVLTLYGQDATTAQGGLFAEEDAGDASSHRGATAAGDVGGGGQRRQGVRASRGSRGRPRPGDRDQPVGGTGETESLGTQGATAEAVNPNSAEAHDA